MTLPRGVYLDLKKVRIIELAEQGVRVRDIALQCRVSERYVQITLSSVGMTRAVDDPRQLRLPE